VERRSSSLELIPQQKAKSNSNFTKFKEDFFFPTKLEEKYTEMIY